jgi:serine/threonine protein kinase
VDGKIQVAIKESRIKELDALDLERIYSLHHPHLIQSLATCVIGNLYYTIFPWAAGGTLGDFWEREDGRERTAQLALWSLRQMFGLASALKALHTINCRHGNLKPDNILHFNSACEDILVIAAIHSSRSFLTPTSLRVDPTRNRTTTPLYDAPEVEGDPITLRSRKYDIWSLGCILLEFVIWFFYDFESIRIFNYARSEDGGVESYLKITEAIEALQQDPRCKSGTFEALLKLIKDDLLQVEVTRRATATEAVAKLEEIFMEAEIRPEYLVNTGGSVPIKAPIFQEPRRKSIARELEDSVIVE